THSNVTTDNAFCHENSRNATPIERASAVHSSSIARPTTCVSVEDPASEPPFFRPSAQQFDHSKIDAQHDQPHRQPNLRPRAAADSECPRAHDVGDIARYQHPTRNQQRLNRL